MCGCCEYYVTPIFAEYGHLEMAEVMALAKCDLIAKIVV